ncbi:hypothetical protein M405DRAFT_809788 [Rhizopogon salebrosus TDB-379]|nr:hypothetical protein M405DRAFT_809788 [Rhizopogon salebrosus TDB-379]
MFSSFTYLTVALAFASSILGAVIPITTALTSSTTSATATSTSHHITGPVGALFKNSVHDRVYLSEAPEATPSAGADELATVRRSGELWRGLEHEEIDSVVVPSRRSGELWRGLEHEEITKDGPVPSRRSGELWRGLEHEEVTRAGPVLRRSGELWRGLEHEEVSASAI